MSNREGAVTFLAGCVIDKDYVYLVTALDSLDREDVYTRMYFLDESVTELNEKFSSIDLPDWRVVSACVKGATPDSPRLMCCLSEMGDVHYSSLAGTKTERIPGAGLPTAEEYGHGYVSKLREIGTRLYVCGVGGQVYRREGTQWTEFSDGLLMDPSHLDDTVNMLQSGDLDALSDMFDDIVSLNDINGIDENDIYTVGDLGRIYHLEDDTWEAVDSPTDETLLSIKCVSKDEVWICGYNGTLLKGNWKTGFKDMSSVHDNESFLSVEKFNDLVYLVSEQGLYTYNGSKIQRVKTNLVPDIKGGIFLGAKDGVLWLIDYKDLAWFDGTTWTRVVFLNNDPLI